MCGAPYSTYLLCFTALFILFFGTPGAVLASLYLMWCRGSASTHVLREFAVYDVTIYDSWMPATSFNTFLGPVSCVD
jgi:hypothetical protein